MSFTIWLEIGHDATLRTKQTPEGFTHDWEVFVRGCNGAEVHHYIEKVVFYLHETFQKPKRVVKEPPFSLRTSGYGGFNLPIEVHLKNNQEPKKIRFNYDLQLHPTGPPIHKVQKKRYVFHNPSEEFRIKLLKGGALTGDVGDNGSKLIEEKNQMAGINKSKVTSAEIAKKHKIRLDEPKNSDFLNLFGTPITKTSRNPEPPAKPKEPSKPLIKPEKTDKDGKDKSDKSKSKSSHKDKEKKSSESVDRKNRDERKKIKDEKGNSSRDRSKEKSSKKDREKDKSPLPKPHSPSPKRSPKRPASSSPAPTKSARKEPEHPKEDKDHLREEKRQQEKERKDEKKIKKEKHKDHKESKHKDRDKEHKEHKSKEGSKENKRDTSPNKIIIKDENVIASSQPVQKTEKKEKVRESPKDQQVKDELKHRHKKKDKKEKREEKHSKSDKRSSEKQANSQKHKEKEIITMNDKNNLFGSPKSEPSSTPLQEELNNKNDNLTTYKDEDSSNDSLVKQQSREASPEVPPPSRSPSPVINVEPAKKPVEVDKMERRKDEKKKEKKERKKDKKGDKDHEKRKKRKSDGVNNVEVEQPPVKVSKDEENNNSDDESKVSSTEDVNTSSRNKCNMEVLRDLQHKIMSLRDNADLQRVVQLIAETGKYEVSANTFDFDLCVLDPSTVSQLQDFMSTVTYL